MYGRPRKVVWNCILGKLPIASYDHFQVCCTVVKTKLKKEYDKTFNKNPIVIALRLVLVLWLFIIVITRWLQVYSLQICTKWLEVHRYPPVSSCSASTMCRLHLWQHLLVISVACWAKKTNRMRVHNHFFQQSTSACG